MTVLVTGATGNVGRQVVTQLFDNGDRVRALVRDPARARLPVETVRGDLAAPDSLADALSEVDSVFLIWPMFTASTLPAILDLIREQGARVVFLATGAIADLDMDGQRGLLAESGLEWTLLVPSAFAVNLLWWARQIRAGDVVRGSHGSLAMPLIHERDIAAVAVRALTEPGHAGAVHTITGPEILSQAEQVEAIGRAIGRPLRWQEVPRPEAREQLVAGGLPGEFADTLLDTYAELATKPPMEVTAAVEKVTGVPARTVHQWATDHRADFS
jgi:uncharacterized protein YbjT (DUF2867 family)